MTYTSVTIGFLYHTRMNFSLLHPVTIIIHATNNPHLQPPPQGQWLTQYMNRYHRHYLQMTNQYVNINMSLLFLYSVGGAMINYAIMLYTHTRYILLWPLVLCINQNENLPLTSCHKHTIVIIDCVNYHHLWLHDCTTLPLTLITT